MPHPIRKRADGRMVYSVPLIIFMDDVSGNISKQWNKHFVVYMSNANLPREMIEKEFNVRYVSSSPHASPMELMKAVRDSIRYGIIYATLILRLNIYRYCIVLLQRQECQHGIVETKRKCFCFLTLFFLQVITRCMRKSAAIMACSATYSVVLVMLVAPRPRKRV